MKMMRKANLQGTIVKNKGVRHDRDSVRLVSDSKIMLRSLHTDALDAKTSCKE